jgi:hypothetical protein
MNFSASTSYYRLHWAAMRQQRHDLNELPLPFLDPIQGCPFALTKRFPTTRALIAFFNLAVDNDVARTLFPSVATAILSTKLFFGIYDTLWPQKATSVGYLAPFLSRPRFRVVLPLDDLARMIHGDQSKTRAAAAACRKRR